MYRKAAMFFRKLANESCGMRESATFSLRYIKQCQIFWHL